MTISYRDPSNRKSSLTATGLQAAIRARAREIYERSGKLPGRDVQNWTQAEAEVMQEWSEKEWSKSPVAGRTAIVVNINGVEYIGEYTPVEADGYRPGEFDRGQHVPIRIVGSKMFVTRPNGTELETTLINNRA
jgi:hypothetical protein